MVMPSIIWCGSISISGRSLHVPGSDSSALQITYFGFGESLGHERPLHAVGKARAAAPAQARLLHFINDRLRRHFLQRLFQRAIAVVLHVHIDLVRILDAPAPADHRSFRRIGGCSAPAVTGSGGDLRPASRSSMIRSNFSCVTFS